MEQEEEEENPTTLVLILPPEEQLDQQHATKEVKMTKKSQTKTALSGRGSEHVGRGR